MKTSLEKNIKIGIREGLYQGSTLNQINKIAAIKTTLFFYKNELYKIRWIFKNDGGKLERVSEEIQNYLIQKYGPVNSETIFGLKVWKGEKNYLQTFFESNEFQVEYRDNIIHQTLQTLE